MIQKAFRYKELLTECEIHLVTIDKNGKPTKIPDKLRQKIETN